MGLGSKVPSKHQVRKCVRSLKQTYRQSKIPSHPPPLAFFLLENDAFPF